MLHVKLPDGKILDFDGPHTVHEVAMSIGKGLAKAALAGEVNGELVDLSYVIESDAELNIVTQKHPVAPALLRHSCAHIMAYAVQRLYPETKFGIGPDIENGFYYDFDLEETISSDDLPRIEDEMNRIIADKVEFEREVMSREDAIAFFTERGQQLKLELLAEMPDEQVSIYRCGEFADLCRGPHIPDTSKAPFFKLTSVAGAYWRGDERNKMLQRVYGAAFADKKELKKHLHALAEARKRDHRVIGRQMELFSLQEEGPGFPFFPPNGANVIDQMHRYWREQHVKNGYELIITPSVLEHSLWIRSGHYDNYRDNMYFTEVDERKFAIKPMNCPGAMLIYKDKQHSYRDLPVRIAEIGRVHRHEKSGVLHGLFRVRSFSIDDAHIICAPDQLEEEIARVIRLVETFYSDFGFEKWEVELSTRPSKAIGSDEMWEKATSALKNALESCALEYDIDEGGGAFYGPKIDFKIIDCLGRKWQCGTVQADFSMPQRLGLEYVGADGEKHVPALIHRAIFGSVERFFGILIEHTAGKFPLWLAPVQAVVMTITDVADEHARTLQKTLIENGIRTSLDLRNEKIGKKVRDATVSNMPYMLVVGEAEAKLGNAALRHGRHGDFGPKPVSEILEGLRSEIDSRSDRSHWSKETN